MQSARLDCVYTETPELHRVGHFKQEGSIPSRLPRSGEGLLVRIQSVI